MGVYSSGVLFWGIAFTEDCIPEAHASADCTVGYHVAFDTPMSYVAITSSIREADDTAAEPVGPVAVDPDWERQLREFCEAHDIPWSAPGWRLVSVINH